MPTIEVNEVELECDEVHESSELMYLVKRSIEDDQLENDVNASCCRS
jgi:hypothetical protein